MDAVRTVSKGVQLYRERVHGSLLIITHSTRILEALTVDAAHIMEKGVIVKNGDASLVDTINEALFDLVGDTVIEFSAAGPQIIEDYEADVRGYLDHE